MHMHLILDMHKLFAKRTILESNIGEQKNINKRMARLKKAWKLDIL